MKSKLSAKTSSTVDESVSSKIGLNVKKRKLEKVVAESTDNTAVDYFKNKQYGARGIRKELKQSSNIDIRIDPDEYQSYFTSYLQQNKKKSLLPESIAHHLLWQGLSDHNILFYGFGNLANALTSYVEDYLSGEDVLEVNGNPSNAQPGTIDLSITACLKNVKSLLNVIASNILKDSTLHFPVSSTQDHLLPMTCRTLCDRLNHHYGRSNSNTSHISTTEFAASATGIPDPGIGKPKTRRSVPSSRHQEWKGKWAHVQSKLYLLIHEIDGPAFACSEAQECLSILSACESVTVIASSASLNVHLLWSQRQLYRFAWKYLCYHTFQHHPLPSDHPFLRTVMSQTARGVVMKETTGKALIQVLRSFAKRHIQFLVRIAKTYFKDKEKYQQGSAIVFSFREALAVALSVMVVRTADDLHVLLKEFVDHDILVEQVGMIRFLISEADFQLVLDHFQDFS